MSAKLYDRVALAQRQLIRAPEPGVLNVRELVRAATLAASSHNTQPWKFKIEANVLQIVPDFTRRCPVVDPDDQHLFKSLGCAAENLSHAAAAQGFASEVSLLSPEEGLRVELLRDTSTKMTPLYSAISRRQCVRAPFEGSAISSEMLRKLEEAGRGRNVRVALLTADNDREAVLEYVTRGNEAQLNDPDFRNELKTWVRFNNGEALRSGDGLAGRVAGQPSLPRWLGNMLFSRVVSPESQSRTDARNIRSSPAIAVFIAASEDKKDCVELGRLYERLALQATLMDLRTAFVNQPVEVRGLRQQFESWLNLRGEKALLAVRIGFGPTAPYSLRRPVDEVIVKPGS